MKKTISELWEDIFQDFNIIEIIEHEGLFKLTADDIRNYKEPRLMAKFDYSKQLPNIFKDNGLGILPTKNGEYIIGKFDIFKKISKAEYEEEVINKVELPSFIETIDPDNIYSESNALNVALLSGMLKETFGEELYQTIQGKMRTNYFNFNILSDDTTTNIEVNGASIEIDGGYEGNRNVILIEAKNYMPDDFVIRQLYYPFRHWKDKVSKKLIPVFFTYDNGIYTLFIYEFEDLYNYNSIKLKKVKRFILSSRDSEKIKKEIIENIEIKKELIQKEVPFPQADSFSKVVGILELIDSGINTANKIAEEIGFDARQGKYYIDALRYLELVDYGNKTGEYMLTGNGFMAMNLDMKSRNELFIKQILSHAPFYEIYRYYLENNEMPNREYIAKTIRSVIDKDQMADETVNRRASTVRGWIQWIIGCQI